MVIIKHEAETNLSKLEDQAPDAPTTPQRLGFLVDEIAVPRDFDRMGESEIAALFGIGA